MDASWDVYITQVQDRPAFVMVDSALANADAFRTHPELVSCKLVVNSFRENGLPDRKAFETIYGFEDAINNLAKKSPANIYAGRFGIGGEVTYHFYTGAGQVLLKNFQTSSELTAIAPFDCKSQSDGLGLVYFDRLYPKPEVRNGIENSKVREQLLKAGDDSTKPREVNHYAYFKTANGMNTFKGTVEKNGYRIIEAAGTPDERGLWFLLFAMTQSPAELDPITWKLTELATATQGIYDGWECPVVAAAK